MKTGLVISTTSDCSQKCPQEIRDGFAYIGPLDAEGFAHTVTIVGFNMRTWAENEPDTLTPMKDALKLIVQDLF